MKILTGSEITEVPYWARKLAELTRIAWTGQDGKCYFPYLPLTKPDLWQTEILADWQKGNLFSWVMEDEGKILAHAALVKKGDVYECGRWLSLPNAPKGTMTRLVGAAIDFARQRNWNFWVECTQAHTSSQRICEIHGLRFAGIGILKKVGEIWWDIIYFDSGDPAQAFQPQPGILADPLGREIKMQEIYAERLEQITSLIRNSPGDQIPPLYFHILPHLESTLREIIRLNV
ncbi:MAG: hypothetical protein UT86_C0002G0061 [Candidatus Magasanikbacteria bacterium GW2011_GWC2_40_17]|uniref:N-acetyltransferase domain-containing protein n=1 Tax=Candidatus Magasanikbacteria bacterium GW2011_GWA2_42_32 TaxID=1619039 RepID=A0A0G1A845_9BACT|nr:MAG: hypothetical protein UT86_C0002G0061 [Candidatus Magasanikbacteria bacterium GW2011_GWC2_40_17]KKS57222.1 MAG: hypothetical protein UV20_C0002G0011 [Candidatus Magasanikbacteria bacterium GW2011_GWA2_42_32]OGH86116.1 MAG: hypothetical protein A2294_02545 [Candidatus Magasanikbacteria bacterium RIFOXYB2_FULL_38_10]